MPSDQDDDYNELCAYTLNHRGPEFIHQHVVDAYMAQHADTKTKPIGITFALVGLYLHVEKKFSGRQVQLAHMRLARKKQTWPAFAIPTDRGSMTVSDVLAVPPGPGRDKAVHDWAASVWGAFRNNSEIVAELLRQVDIA
jgi:Family of unknown function (DUF5946)